MATEFQNKGYTVEMNTFTTQYPELLFPGKSQFSDRPAPMNLNIHRTFSSINPFTWLKLGLRLRKAKPDMLILRFWLPFMAPSMGSIARLTRGEQAHQNNCPHRQYYSARKKGLAINCWQIFLLAALMALW